LDRAEEPAVRWLSRGYLGSDGGWRRAGQPMALLGQALRAGRTPCPDRRAASPRAQTPLTPVSRFHFGDVVVDFLQARVSKRGQPVNSRRRDARLLRMHKPDKAKSSHNTVRDTILPRVNTEVNPGHAGQYPSHHAKQDPQARASHVPTEYPPLWHTQKQPEYGKRRSISPYPVQSRIHDHDGLDGLSKRITYCKADSACDREPYREHTNSSNDRPLQASYD